MAIPKQYDPGRVIKHSTLPEMWTFTVLVDGRETCAIYFGAFFYMIDAQNMMRDHVAGRRQLYGIRATEVA